MKQTLFFALLFCTIQLHAQREIWGTVSNTGDYGFGYIFKTDSIGENIEIVHQFDSINGKYPGEIMQASNGKLYGFTEKGGVGQHEWMFDGGVLYEYDPAIDSFRVVYFFDSWNTDFPYEGPQQLHGLIEPTPGVLYGALASGGLQIGRIFKYTIASDTLENVVAVPTFVGDVGATTQGNRLSGPLFEASNGFLYAATEHYSTCPIAQPFRGTLVKINMLTNTLTNAYVSPCSGPDGYTYLSEFTQEGTSLFSLARQGGANNKGVIYEFNTTTNTYINRHDFTGGVGGWSPSEFVEATNGKFYGIANGGLPSPFYPAGCGIIFEYDAAMDTYTKVYDFTYGTGWNMEVGIYAHDLIASQNGKLYGANRNGVFEYNIVEDTAIAKARFYPIGGATVPDFMSITEICPFPNYHYSNDTVLTACTDMPFSVDAGIENATSINWTHNGVADPFQTNTLLTFANFTVADTGAWYAELTNGCGVTTTQTIHIQASQELVATQTGNTLNVSTPALNYQWINCDSQTPITGETNSSFEVTQDGSYAAVVTNTDNCMDTSACFTFFGLTTDELLQQSIQLYPNPVSDILYLSGTITVDAIVIRNASGQVVLEKKNVQQINVAELAPGTYFVFAQTALGTWRGNFVK